MISFPKDILSSYVHVPRKYVEMDAVTIPADGSFKGGDILQTTHCLELVLSGKMRVYHGDSYQDVAANDILFKKKGNYQLEPDNDYSAVLFFIDDEFIVDFIKEVERLPAPVLKDDNPLFLFKSSDFIKNNMEHALKRIINYETFSPCIVKLTALQVFFQLFSAEPSKQFMAYLRYLISSRKVDLTYFMETNFTQNLNLEEMAKLTGRSLSAFKKDFAKLFETSPQRWLINRRLEKAHYMLSRTDSTVAEIAYECGFENTSHFSRAYKQKYGETPTSSRIAVTIQE